MLADYQRAIQGVAISEGGWSDDPRDPGGATMYGIIQTEYDAWRDIQGKPRQSVRLISQADVGAIFRQQYANPLQFDALPAGVDYAVLDYGINSGVARAAKDLQRLLKVSVDGHIGVQTLAAAKAADPRRLVEQVCDARLGFLQGLGTWRYFGKGWAARVARVRKDALAMTTA